MLILSDLLALALTFLENKDLLSVSPLQCPGHVVSVQSVLERDVLFQEENEGGIQFGDRLYSPGSRQGVGEQRSLSHPLPPALCSNY